MTSASARSRSGKTSLASPDGRTAAVGGRTSAHHSRHYVADATPVIEALVEQAQLGLTRFEREEAEGGAERELLRERGAEFDSMTVRRI
jgi:hypothetical protein